MTKPNAHIKALAAEILAHLRATGRRIKLWDLMVEMGMASDEAVFDQAIEMLPKRSVIRVRGQNGFLMAV